MIIHNVEQNSTEWHQMRLGMPTASEFSKLVSGTGKVSTQIDGYAHHLAAEILAGKPVDNWAGNEWTERGHGFEDEARAEYELMTGDKLKEVGFATTDDGLIGCSPDRMIAGKNAAVEIKCLKAANHVHAAMYIERYGRIPPAYRSQIQGQIMICDLDWIALFFYHPDLPSSFYREPPDLAFQRKLESAIDDLIERRDLIVSTLQESKI